MFYTVTAMEQNFLPLDNTQNVLALLQKGYTFIETDERSEIASSFIVGIPHTTPPKDKNAHMLSQFLVRNQDVTFAVAKSYFEN